MSQKTKKTIVIGSLGEDVHVAGTWGFANIAKKEGYNVTLLGPAVSVKEFIGAIIETDANIIGISYRLSPESAKFHLSNLKNSLQHALPQWLFPAFWFSSAVFFPQKNSYFLATKPLFLRIAFNGSSGILWQRSVE